MKESSRALRKIRVGGINIPILSVICAAGGAAAYLCLTFCSPAFSGRAAQDPHLSRPARGEESLSCRLYVSGLKKEEFPIDLEISEKQYTDEEEAELFEAVFASLQSRILGENPSLSEVRGDLRLPSGIQESGVTLEWDSEDAELLDSDGTVHNSDLEGDGRAVVLTLRMKDGKRQEERRMNVKIFPPHRSESERTAEKFKQYLQQLEQEQKELPEVRLPEEYEGKKLYYRTDGVPDYKALLVLGFVLAFLFYAKDEMDKRNQVKQRERQLMMDYSEVVSKLMVFLGAGMTVRTAWEKIVEDYGRSSGTGQRKERYAYEEMQTTADQWKSGVSEGKAFVEFGRRCGLLPYIKLGTLLEQNRRTGTKNFRAAMELEMISAFEQRKNMARKLGEEAGTKLLIPLFLMLGVVMVIIVVPAFLTFY